MLKIVDIQDLIPGMYVNQVVAQKRAIKVKSKGLVRTPEVIEALKKKGILKLEIDLSKSQLPEEEPQPEEVVEEAEPESPKEEPQVPLAEEMDWAVGMYDQTKMVQQEIFERVKNGEKLDLDMAKSATDRFMSSIVRNQDALTAMTRVRDMDEYSLEHSLNVSVLMGIFAKHLELDPDVSQQLMLAGLLIDAGKALLPENLVTKNGKYTAAEFTAQQEHVSHSLSFIEGIPGVGDITKEVIAQHHERLDGSGYPSGLSGDDISIYGRMVAIVDSYDAITADRNHAKAKYPNQAFALMLKDSDKYDSELVHKFIKAVGVHPVGTVVKLKSNKLAIVTKMNKTDPLKPLVTIFYNPKAGGHTNVKRLDLSSKKTDDGIEYAIRPEEFKINFKKFFREVFVHSLAD